MIVATSAIPATLEKAAIAWEAVTPEHAATARRAWQRFGKGNRPAGAPLLFKDEDFARTDIASARTAR